MPLLSLRHAGALLLGALPGAAHAFCGTFVGAADSTLTNRASHAVIAREGSQTTLSLAMDFEGDTSRFALLLPMPEVLDASQVYTPDPALLDAVRTYGDARLVAYTCENALGQQGPSFTGVGCGTALGCADGGLYGYGDTAGWDGDYGVTVENAFTVGGYELVVLSAEESSGLWLWLDANGFSVPPGGERILQEYIDAGVYFVAVKIDLDHLDMAGEWLPPLQFRYESSAFMLPIRIGTISAGGEAQEVILSVFSREEQGEVGIANYPEAQVERECMTDTDDFATWYEERLGSALGGEAGWVREHSWPVFSQQGGYHCDPCTSVGDFEPEELGMLGMEPIGDVHLTRLRVRYTPEQATQDLALYFNGITGVKEQTRFIQYDHELEFLWPVCDLGFVENPGECESLRGSDTNPITGCAAALPLGLLGFFAGVAGLRRRR